MRFRTTRELCYLAGVMDDYRPPDKSYVGVRTRSDELVQRFVKFALLLGADPRKILIEEAGEVKHAYFYHSRIARMIREVLERKASLPRRSRELAACLVAGALDSKGFVDERGVRFSRLDKADGLMLEMLGIHTRNGKVMNIGALASLIGKESLLAAGISKVSAHAEKSSQRI
jgi:hypothetical protein